MYWFLPIPSNLQERETGKIVTMEKGSAGTENRYLSDLREYEKLHLDTDQQQQGRGSAFFLCEFGFSI
jgi:hypothetical protein